MIKQSTPPFASVAVSDAYQALPASAREAAFTLRDLIFAVAAETPKAGPIEETLRWGQPSYITPKTKAGSTLRIGATKAGEAAIFAHCGTQIISTYAATFPNMDRIEGNRAVIFDNADASAPDRLRLLIRHGLTYHLQNR
ncbi:DUF1801 domain-containing protein [Roseobacter sp. CCS2]|uniref:DUF1801 domain-containing protein n=1 Tax=Roseobacter sp. CCS2 TaxID=391593 RepID=UPI0000F404D1|nr:DUF1801 domain-containing protein [Roseobacter sp. CCS2]EBA13598.1 hypothetical protein RCCS2_06914 [Roseobacter sp. CCS2]